MATVVSDLCRESGVDNAGELGGRTVTRAFTLTVGGEFAPLPVRVVGDLYGEGARDIVLALLGAVLLELLVVDSVLDTLRTVALLFTFARGLTTFPLLRGGERDVPGAGECGLNGDVGLDLGALREDGRIEVSML